MNFSCFVEIILDFMFTLFVANIYQIILNLCWKLFFVSSFGSFIYYFCYYYYEYFWNARSMIICPGKFKTGCAFLLRSWKFIELRRPTSQNETCAHKIYSRQWNQQKETTGSNFLQLTSDILWRKLLFATQTAVE